MSEVIWKTPIYDGEELFHYKISNLGVLKRMKFTTTYVQARYGFPPKTHIRVKPQLDSIKFRKNVKYKALKAKIPIYTEAGTISNYAKHVYLYKLVAETFIENPNNYTYIKYLDEDITNNSASNLEWQEFSNITIDKLLKRKNPRTYRRKPRNRVLTLEVIHAVHLMKKKEICYREIAE